MKKISFGHWICTRTHVFPVHDSIQHFTSGFVSCALASGAKPTDPASVEPTSEASTSVLLPRLCVFIFDLPTV